MSQEDEKKNKKKNETMFDKWYISFTIIGGIGLV